MPGTEHVVLLDGAGRAVGTQPKASVHGVRTPLHLAFSCHVIDDAGRVLLTRRASTKRTWPGVWSNACCGHPQLGETLRGAVERRLRDELGLVVERIAVALPDFTYRAVMDDGTVEHERCPVLVAEVKGIPLLHPEEVDDLRWQSWTELVARAAAHGASLSPWAVEQVAQLDGLMRSPASWLASDHAERGQALLDRTVELGRAVDPPVSSEGHFADALGVVARPVGELLASFLAARSLAIADIDPLLAEVTDEIRGLVAAGGKRLRPAFVHWGHRATSAEADDAVLYPAAAVELLHTFALLHDDVMDRSAVRRGRPTAHAALRDRHRAEARCGDAGWFGASAAILAGDLVYVWADELLHRTPLPPAARNRARAVFTTLREEVIAGQHLDLLLAADPGADEARARQVALLKSARYTVTRPLLLGAALAPVADGERVAGALAGYGDAVGLAFQLRDDILGLFGDPCITGKSDLDDLHEGKRTVLMLRALRLADPAQRTVLEAALGDPALDERGADRVRDIVVDTGALASVESLLGTEHARALEAIDDLPDDPRAALVDLAQLAIRRSA
jgi:isopentenyl-diphosphate delta-isomerase type 1